MELKDLQDKHKGLGFIVGSGPSVHFQDLEFLKDYPTIAVNAGILKIPFANYFATDDIAVTPWNYFAEELPKLDTVCLLYKGKLEGHTGDIPQSRIVWFGHKCWYEPSKRKYHSDGLIMTKDAQKPIIGARTSTGTAIHLAYIMGFDPIVLIGNDCCHYQRKRYFWQFPGEKKAYRVDGMPIVFVADRGKMGDKSIDKHSVDFMQYFNALSKQCKKQNINIIDASGDFGLLKCFDKMELRDILDDYT